MKKYVFNISKIIVVLTVVLLASCDSIFVPDPIDPRLPKYTEKGNNVAGAYIDGMIWESEEEVVSIPFLHLYTVDKPYLDVWKEKDSIRMQFNGSLAEEEARVEFYLTGLGISEFNDLPKLEGQKIQLDGVVNAGYFYKKGANAGVQKGATVVKGVGQLYFRNVSPIVTMTDSDREETRTVIISGTFGFTVKGPDGKEIKVASGRFDYKFREGDNVEVR